jgi:CelD/BcsL family acetyltransferase involved in cellulose biosynthesis
MSSLIVEQVGSEAALAALGPEWLALERSSGNALPFRTFEWVSCWWKHLREERAAVTDTLAVRAVRTETGRLVGVAPLMLTERPAVGPVRLRCVQFMGADPNVTEIRGAICEPALAAACHAALRADVARLEGQTCDWVQWAGLAGAEQAAFEDPSIRWSGETMCSVLTLPSSWSELHGSLPRNLKESIRKCYNSLRRDGLQPALEVVTERARVASTLEDFFRLHGARANLAGTTRHPDVFAHPRSRSFLVDACERFAERGTLRVFRLVVRDELVATRIGFAVGDTLYLYYSGYDPTYAQYGVMTTTLVEAIKYAIAEGFRHVNLSTGKDVSKTRWRPDEVVYRQATLMPASAFGRLKYEAALVAKRAIHGARLQHALSRGPGLLAP